MSVSKLCGSLCSGAPRVRSGQRAGSLGDQALSSIASDQSCQMLIGPRSYVYDGEGGPDRELFNIHMELFEVPPGLGGGSRPADDRGPDPVLPELLVAVAVRLAGQGDAPSMVLHCRWPGVRLWLWSEVAVRLTSSSVLSSPTGGAGTDDRVVPRGPVQCCAAGPQPAGAQNLTSKLAQLWPSGGEGGSRLSTGGSSPCFAG